MKNLILDLNNKIEYFGISSKTVTGFVNIPIPLSKPTKVIIKKSPCTSNAYLVYVQFVYMLATYYIYYIGNTPIVDNIENISGEQYITKHSEEITQFNI